jgi:hypothetical protein
VADAVSSSRWLDRAVGLQVTLGPILLAELVLAVFMTKLFRLRIDDRVNGTAEDCSEWGFPCHLRDGPLSADRWL